MKRIGLLVLAIITCISLAACTNNKKGEFKLDDIKPPEKQEAPVAEKEDVERSTEQDKVVNLLDEMTNAQKKEINIFLSNFSEAHYGTYYSDETSDKISFAYTHNLINNKNFNEVYDGTHYGISADLVDSTLKRFFGKTVSHNSTADGEWIYRDGTFLRPAADGESYAYYSIATNMRKLNNGTYEVEFNVYFNSQNPHDYVSSKCYTYSVSQAESNSDYCYSGTAVVKSKVHNGSDTYELISYVVD